jgi:CBS domain-containing protein
MAVGEFCNRNVVIARPDEGVRTVAVRMRDYHVGDVVVVASDADPTPVGIVTDRDLAIEVLAQDVRPEDVTVGDLMSARLVTLREDADLAEATATMRGKAIRRLVIVDGQGLLVGVLTADDVVEVLAEELNDLSRLVVYQGEREAQRRLAL